jgi:hypothetical protein
MTARRMLSKDEAWIAAVDMAMSDKARYAESLSREELDAELRAMGRDPAVVRARGLALAAQYLPHATQEAVEASDAEDEPAPESKRGRVISMVVSRAGARRAPGWLFAAALAAAAVLGAFAYLRRAPSEARLPTVPAPIPTDFAPTPPRSAPAASPSATAPEPEPDMPFEDIGDASPRKYDSSRDPPALYGAAKRACAIKDWEECRGLIVRLLAYDPRYRDSKAVMDLRMLALRHVKPTPAQLMPP